MLQIKKRIPEPQSDYKEMLRMFSADICRIEGLLNEVVEESLIDALTYELLSLNQRRRQCISDCKARFSPVLQEKTEVLL